MSMQILIARYRAETSMRFFLCECDDADVRSRAWVWLAFHGVRNSEFHLNRA